MSTRAELLASDIQVAPVELVKSLAEEFANKPSVLEFLRLLSSKFSPNSHLSGDNEDLTIEFALLERLCDIPNPSKSELSAAVFLATYISSSHFIGLLEYWQLDQDLEQAGKHLREAVQSRNSKMDKYVAREAGAKSGRRRNQQKCEDIDSAASALIRLWRRDDSCNYTLPDIARELDSTNVTMEYPARGGWPQRLRSLTKIVIVARAERLQSL